MKVFNKPILGLIALVALAAAGWVYGDYHKWLALGPGGLPYNFSGWMSTTRMRWQKRDPFDTDRYAKVIGAPGDCAFISDLPRRQGSRPSIGVHPVPHRQLNQLPNNEMKSKITELFDALIARRADLVAYKLSFFEKRHNAVTLLQPEKGHADAQATHGEVGHIHPSDGSMHMILSPSDTKKVIEAGWGECHPLAGVMLGLPDTYMMIYPPRDEQELAVTVRLLDAAVTYMAKLSCSITTPN